MSKLLEDPKVAALVEKETLKATKAAVKAAAENVQEAIDSAKENDEFPSGKVAYAASLRAIKASIKSLAQPGMLSNPPATK